MPGPALRVALLGYGLAGKVFHAPLITTTPGLELAAVVSSRAAEIAADLPGVAVCASLDEALGLGVDLVVIATPNDSHAPLAAAAIAAGRHVVVDKPFAVTLAQAEALRDAAAAQGVVLSVFHNRRWASDFLTLRRLIGEGALGEVAHFEARFDRFRPQPRDRWRERPGPGAGTWYDLGAHLIDQALRLFGPPEAVWADLAAQRGEGLATDYFHAVLRWPNRQAILHAGSIAADPGPTLAVHGTRGSYAKFGQDPQEEQSKQGLRPGDANWGADPRPGVLTTVADDGRAEVVTPQAERGDYSAYYRAVRDAIVDGAPNPVPPEQAVEVMRIIEAGIESSAARREIMLR